MTGCPVCRKELAPATVGGITVDGCPTCGGVWFDRGELTRIARRDPTQLAAIDRAFEAAGAAPEAENGGCPRCTASLIQFEPPQTPGLALLACPARHGVWLRENDFEAIAARVTQWRAQRGDAPGAPATVPGARMRDVARVLMSRLCDKCREPNAAASPVCWACGSVLGSVPAQFVCPSCNHALASLAYEGIAVNHCDHCGGLWLDRGELGALIRLDQDALQQLQDRLLPGSPAAVTSEEDPLTCPACDRTMRQHEYAVGSGVLMHSCSACGGIWLDRAALVPIQQFVEFNESYLAPPAP